MDDDRGAPPKLARLSEDNRRAVERVQDLIKELEIVQEIERQILTRDLTS
ncbi:MAG TPA: hypothetical protein VM120_03910 [Bryobacteraceae bacterium]|nr:hypothetical protein [Bryobacteraceae bacterium]